MMVMPTDIAAYTPASRTAAMNRFSRSAALIFQARSVSLGLRCNRLPRGGIERKYDVHLVLGLILNNHEAPRDLAVLSEAQHLARQEGILQFHLPQLIADGRLVQAAGVLNGGR